MVRTGPLEKTVYDWYSYPVQTISSKPEVACSIPTALKQNVRLALCGHIQSNIISIIKACGGNKRWPCCTSRGSGVEVIVIQYKYKVFLLKETHLYRCVSDFPLVNTEREFLMKLRFGNHSLNLRTTIARKLCALGILREQDFSIKISTNSLRPTNYT